MRSQEIVVGDEEGGECDRAIPRTKAIAGAQMIFVSAIEAFDELFIAAVFFRFLVEILQTDDGAMRERNRAFLCAALGIEKVQRIRISGIAVGDERERLRDRRGAHGFLHGNGCG